MESYSGCKPALEKKARGWSMFGLEKKKTRECYKSTKKNQMIGN